jgi:hypothetical protein
VLHRPIETARLIGHHDKYSEQSLLIKVALVLGRLKCFSKLAHKPNRIALVLS